MAERAIPHRDFRSAEPRGLRRAGNGFFGQELRRGHVAREQPSPDSIWPEADQEVAARRFHPPGVPALSPGDCRSLGRQSHGRLVRAGGRGEGDGRALFSPGIEYRVPDRVF